MRVPLIQIDAFADALFTGNPAAVMPLDQWPADRLLQQVAAENNLSETAFLVAELPAQAGAPEAGLPAYWLRWFTPVIEVDLCGHATLAAASYLFCDVHPEAERLQFWTRSGWLHVSREGSGEITLDFPAEPMLAVAVDPVIERALGVPILQALQGTDLICILDSAETVRQLTPDFQSLGALPLRGLVVTSTGEGTRFDFVSRYFGAFVGIAEDPVTGSSHTQLVPLWAQRLGRTSLTAGQLSPRGGTLRCRLDGDRVLLSGRCHRYLEGFASIPAC
ncbi:MAG: PhzF family phenazine biosynthesis protein [Jatrophihabitantaceae bacterium]